MDTIGVVAEPDHPVFGRVAERLVARGFGVEFILPHEAFDQSSVAELSALVNTVAGRRSFEALRYADGSGIETWNGFVATTTLSCRLVALHALEELGCPVPSASFAPDGDDIVSRRRFRWNTLADADGDFWRERIEEESERQRYYAVNDGLETHITAVTVRSKLTEHRPGIEEADVDVELATRVRELLDRFDARTVAIDFARGSAGWVAVDVDPTPQFFDAGLERRLADSMASLTTIGA